MELNTGRIGSLLSDRLVIGDAARGIASLHADRSFWGWVLRVISWIYSPSCYSDENRRTVACVKKYLIDQIGEDRLSRVCTRYGLGLKSDGSPLLSRDLAKIFTGVQDVKIEDIEELIEIAKREALPWPRNISLDLRDKLKEVQNSSELSAEIFAQTYQELQQLVIIAGGRPVKVPPISGDISGAEPSEVTARYYYDSHLADRERLELVEENPTDSLETFIHNFVVRIIGREMNVGMLIRAPNEPDRLGFPDPQGRPRFYRVGAKIISGEGMVSYVLIPATSDSGLKSIRFFRGTSTRMSAIDASSTMITDMERNFGYRAFKSGRIYEKIVRDTLGPISIGAGHSLGSTTLQYLLAENGDFKEAYLFNGPGVPKSVDRQFKQRMSQPEANPLKLFVRFSKYDIFHKVGGERHLGCEAPPNVEVDYFKYYPRARTAAAYAHVQVPDRENRYVGRDGGHTKEQVDRILNRAKHSRGYESWRRALGPCIAAIIRLIRDIFRTIFGSRAERLRGIQIGTFLDGVWETKHYRPKDLRQL